MLLLLAFFEGLRRGLPFEPVFVTINHLEERLLDQVWARAPHTPLFGSYLRRIPPSMIGSVVKPS